MDNQFNCPEDGCGRSFTSQRGLNTHGLAHKNAQKNDAQPEAVNAPTNDAAPAEVRETVPQPPAPPASTTTTTANIVRNDLPQTSVAQQEKQLKQLEAERAAREGQRYYFKFPAIRGEVCEFCGLNYKQCDHYKPYHLKLGDFVCLCGRSDTKKDPLAIQQLTLLYLPHRRFFLCDSAGCEKKYVERFGGFEKHVSWHFFRREIPLYGGLLADPDEGRETSLN